jgi:hypothetical protein
LTTGAVVIGASIILFDPLFQGLAISLVFGAIVSDIDCCAVDLLCYGEKEMGILKVPQKKGCRNYKRKY